MTELSLRLAVSLAQIAAVMGIVMLTVMILTLAERKVLGWMQDRMGPMEVGPYGILQPLADGVKLFFKEDIVPAGANKAMFALAPMLTMVVSLIGFAVIPFGSNLGNFPMVIADLNVGLLYVFAMGSLAVYGAVLGGWASNNKWSLLGGMRSAAQMVSNPWPLATCWLSNTATRFGSARAAVAPRAADNTPSMPLAPRLQ